MRVRLAAYSTNMPLTQPHTFIPRDTAHQSQASLEQVSALPSRCVFSLVHSARNAEWGHDRGRVLGRDGWLR